MTQRLPRSSRSPGLILPPAKNDAAKRAAPTIVRAMRAGLAKKAPAPPKPKTANPKYSAALIATSAMRMRRVIAGSLYNASPLEERSDGANGGCRSSAPHPQALRIENRRVEPFRRAALADDLDLEPARGRRELFRNIAERQRLADAMAIAPGRHPADHFAVMPDRFVAERVGVKRVDRESLQAQLAAALLLARRRLAADKVGLLEIDEAAEAGLVGSVDRPVLFHPGAEALFEPHAEQRAHAELLQAEALAFLQQQVIERALIFRPDPDFVAEIAGKGDAADQSRDHADIHATEGQEWELLVRNVLAGDRLEQRARFRSGDRQTGIVHRRGADQNAARRRMPLEPAHIMAFRRVGADEQ